MGATTITRVYGEAAYRRRDGLSIPFMSRPLIVALLVLTIASLSMMPPNANAQTPPDTPESEGGSVEGDRAALVALYRATNGPNWYKRTDWLSDAPLGEWHGVTTDSSGRVVSINLSGRIIIVWEQLNGPIPPELGNLTKLERLDLSYNGLNGPIPPELGNLHSLVFLDLSYNGLITGPIPPELGNLRSLVWLNLSYNDLNGPIPPELGNLHSLAYLDLGNLSSLAYFVPVNRLTGPIPPELGGLTNLRYLYLGGNELTGSVPPELGGLTNLSYLYLQANRLTGPSLPNWAVSPTWRRSTSAKMN